MKRNKKRREISPKYSLLIMFLICVVLIGATRATNGVSSGIGTVVAEAVIVPMQKGMNRLGGVFSNITANWKSKKDLVDENKELNSKIKSLKSQLDQVEVDQKELSELQKLYKLDRSYKEYDKVAASVIGKDSGNWFSTFLINKGKKSGIKIGMNVISDGGLVGIVTDAGQNYSKIRSIIDDHSEVSAVAVSTQDLLMVNGSLKSMDQKQMIEFSDLRYSPNSKVKTGDKLVTSSISSKYLKGIPIGYITEIKTDNGQLTKSGHLVTIVDFNHLEHVLVIKKLKTTTE